MHLLQAGEYRQGGRSYPDGSFAGSKDRLPAGAVCFSIFLLEENYAHFSLAEHIPGPTTRLMQELAKELDTVIIASLFEKRAKGVYHNTLAVIDAGGSTWEGIVNNTSRTTRAITRSSISPRATRGIRCLTQNTAGSARSSAGTSGTRRQPASPASWELRSSSTPPPSVGLHRRTMS